MRLGLMTSFNYLRSPGPLSFTNLALYGVLIVLAACTAFAGWKIAATRSRAATTIQRQSSVRSQYRAATSRVVRLSATMRPHGFRAGVHGSPRRRPTALRTSLNIVQPTPQRRSAATSARAAAVWVAKRRVRISVVGIATGSRSSAIISVGGKTEIVTVGDLIDGERVTDIRERRITLSNQQIIALGDVNR